MLTIYHQKKKRERKIRFLFVVKQDKIEFLKFLKSSLHVYKNSREKLFHKKF